MTMTVTGMRSNKPVTMDIEQLRGWATFMDRAMIASLIATIVAVAALGITTWLSFRFSGAVRAHEYAAIHRYKVEMGKHAAELEQEVSKARERTLELEQAASQADARAADPAPAPVVAAETPPPARQEVAPESAAPSREAEPSPIVASLKKYAGTKAALYVLDEAPDAPAVAATISGYLSEAGWAPL